MESGKQSVRLLMQKERERRERLRRQAAAAASSTIQQEHRQQNAGEPAPSAAQEAQACQKTTVTAAPSAPPKQASQVSLPAESGGCFRAKAELPADFFDAAVGAPSCTPQADVELALFSDAADVKVDAEASAAQVVVEKLSLDAGEKEGVEASEEVEEEEGVIFEIEEPDESLLLPVHAESFLNATSENRTQKTETEQPRDDISDPPGELEPVSVTSSSQTGAALSENSPDGIFKTAGRATVSGIPETRQDRGGEGISHAAGPPLVPEAATVPPITPSAVTSALLASATCDELRWYRPFDTAFHSELLHEEEELAQLQREAQVAAEKRAAAAREAASAAAAAAVAAAAAAAADAETNKKHEAAGGSSLTKHQLAKRKAAAEATAAAAAAAEAAATAAAAAAEKHAAASEALLGKARAAKAVKLAQQRQKATEDAPVPWGFFDDEEREAAMRGLTGPKRLQELVQRAEERRRDMAEDLQERKQDLLRHREDVRRFVLRVEEQAHDASAYQMRIERLKKKRQAASADAEYSLHGAIKEEAPSAGDTHPSEGVAHTVKRPSAHTRTASAAEETASGELVTADMKQELKRRVKVEQHELPSSIVKDSRETSPGDSATSLRRGGDSDIPVDGNVAGPSLQKAQPSSVKTHQGEDAELSEYTKQKLLTAHLLAAAAAGNQTPQAKEEMRPYSNTEQPRSLQAACSRLEDEGTNTAEDDDEDFSGDEDDDSRWRAKSLLTYASVPGT